MASKHYSEKYMKWSARLGAVAWFLIMIVCLFFFWKPPAAKAGVQDQGQASHLAVPDQPAELPYAGAGRTYYFPASHREFQLNTLVPGSAAAAFYGAPLSGYAGFVHKVYTMWGTGVRVAYHDRVTT